MSNSQPGIAEKQKRNWKQWLLITGAVVAVALVAGILLFQAKPGGPPAPPSYPNVIIWNGLSCSGTDNCGFVPTVRNVTVGTTVTWMNNGGRTHTVTTCDSSHSDPHCPALDTSGLDSFDSNVDSGTSFSHTFTGPGHYYYYCRPHPWMQGEIIVQ
jgi:nitrite reductase (NO-forming)